MPLPSNLPSLTPRSMVGESKFSTTFTSAALFIERRVRYTPTPVLRKPVSSIISLPAESEDAQITGTTRSLTRRLLALNIRQAS
jgi:hypothetical protein